MFNVGAVVQSIRRHAVAIIVIFALALAAGVGSSYLKTGDEAKKISEKAFTAEAVVYFTMNDVYGGMIEAESNFLISDARRTVVGDKVAGEIRRIYGSEVNVSSPWWEDEEKNARYYTHYVFVDVSAPTEEIALAAANEAAVRAATAMEETLPVKSAVVAEAAYVKQSDSTKAADRGTESLDNIESALVTSSSISVKKLVIFGFVGLFGAIFVFACVDILSRRIRSERDIEKMLDLTVLGTVKNDADYEGIAALLNVLLSRNSMKSLALAGVCASDGAADVFEKISPYLPQALSCVEALSENGSVATVAECESVALVLAEGAASGAQIDRALKALRVADVPVAGVVFIPKSKK